MRRSFILDVVVVTLISAAAFTAGRYTSSEEAPVTVNQPRQLKNQYSVYDPAAVHLHSLRLGMMREVTRLVKARGWTQTEAAKVLGVTQSRVSDVYRGKGQNFTLDTLAQWIVLLGHKVTVTVDGTDVLQPDSQDNVAYLSRALQLDPDNTSIRTDRGFAYREAGQFDLAIADFTRCMELGPERPGPRFNRAVTFLKAGQVQDCLRDCDQLIAEHSDYAGGWQLRGQAYAALKQYPKAIEDYTHAAELEPDVPSQVYQQRGQAYEALGEPEKAAADYARHRKWWP